jgi:hypothetical protein
MLISDALASIYFTPLQAKSVPIESIESARFEVRPDLKGLTFSEGGPKAWIVAVIRTR